MKAENTNEQLIYRNNVLATRIFGIVLLLIGLFLTFSSWFLTNYFGVTDSFSKIILTIGFVFVGLLLVFISYFLITQKDSEMIFDGKSKILYYSEKNFFSRKKSQHLFSEIVNFGQEHTSTENQDYFTNYLHLANCSGLEIPVANQTNKELQDRQIQEIKDFIKF